MKAETSQKTARLTFREHVAELRAYAMWGGLFFVTAAVLIFLYASNTVIAYLLHGAPSGLVFLTPLGPFIFRMNIACLGGVLVSLPLWIVFILRFAGAELERQHRAFAYGAACASFLLGLGAIALTYLYLVPASFRVLARFAVPSTTVMLTAENYLSFTIMHLVVAFVALQIPVVVMALAYLQLLDPRILARNRKWVFVGLLTVFALFTPATDIITLLVIGMLSCELGIAAGKLVYNKPVITNR